MEIRTNPDISINTKLGDFVNLGVLFSDYVDQ